MNWLRQKALAWLFPAENVIVAPKAPALACPACAASHPNLPIPTSAVHATVRCPCGAAFDVFPQANWRVHLRANVS